jgi:hypothetical protein
MPHIKNLTVLLSLAAALFLSSTAGSHFGQEDHGEFWSVVRTIENILTGENAGKTANVIGRSTELIYGGKVLNLRDVVSGKVPSCSLADTSFHGATIDARTNASEDMGFIRLKTRRADTTQVRYHTIVVLKDSIGKFEIVSWHTSSN